ncbi:3-hydroxy-3-methylglutaryl-coenzyme A reductase [Penicillium desertorum]|uniref:hydroxymethylglutaryl-CoA reductase (NADPH) n=1 Tax=Penicillium desertorum TaxID=1303715 RepID=A0A9W9WPT9_9EURO|nr:3-hydroxy-3-methylglutaryl-coenzyme A reductase [Penicillium desertorum]
MAVEISNSAVLSSLLPSRPTASNEPTSFSISGNEQDILESHSFHGTRLEEVKLKDLEKLAKSPLQAVIIRRAFVRALCRKDDLPDTFIEDLPFLNYDYEKVLGNCCENVIGYMPIPIGFAGHILIDGHEFLVPMATTEGALVAGVARGFKALNLSGGTTTVVSADAMTRAPCLRFSCLSAAHKAKIWMESHDGKSILKEAFSKTSKHCVLTEVSAAIVGNYLYPRFIAKTGDAMGMNMISKCVESAISEMKDRGFKDLELISISGNLCSDKKSAAVNWVEGRGKSVVAQSQVSASAIKNVLKTDSSKLVSLNCAKNHIGSAIAGTLGGFNAHASNIVSAIFLATGQDIAQNVESSQCITTMEQWVQTI